MTDHNDDEPQTALLLTDAEWDDLSLMVGVYKSERQYVLQSFTCTSGNASTMINDIKRRIALADRIIEASR